MYTQGRSVSVDTYPSPSKDSTKKSTKSSDASSFEVHSPRCVSQSDFLPFVNQSKKPSPDPRLVSQSQFLSMLSNACYGLKKIDPKNPFDNALKSTLDHLQQSNLDQLSMMNLKFAQSKDKPTITSTSIDANMLFIAMGRQAKYRMDQPVNWPEAHDLKLGSETIKYRYQDTQQPPITQSINLPIAKLIGFIEQFESVDSLCAHSEKLIQDARDNGWFNAIAASGLSSIEHVYICLIWSYFSSKVELEEQEMSLGLISLELFQIYNMEEPTFSINSITTIDLFQADQREGYLNYLFKPFQDSNIYNQREIQEKKLEVHQRLAKDFNSSTISRFAYILTLNNEPYPKMTRCYPRQGCKTEQAFWMMLPGQTEEMTAIMTYGSIVNIDKANINDRVVNIGVGTGLVVLGTTTAIFSAGLLARNSGLLISSGVDLLDRGIYGTKQENLPSSVAKQLGKNLLGAIVCSVASDIVSKHLVPKADNKVGQLAKLTYEKAQHNFPKTTDNITTIRNSTFSASRPTLSYLARITHTGMGKGLHSGATWVVSEIGHGIINQTMNVAGFSIDQNSQINPANFHPITQKSLSNRQQFVSSCVTGVIAHFAEELLRGMKFKLNLDKTLSEKKLGFILETTKQPLNRDGKNQYFSSCWIEDGAAISADTLIHVLEKISIQLVIGTTNNVIKGDLKIANVVGKQIIVEIFLGFSRSCKDVVTRRQIEEFHNFKIADMERSIEKDKNDTQEKNDLITQRFMDNEQKEKDAYEEKKSELSNRKDIQKKEESILIAKQNTLINEKKENEEKINESKRSIVSVDSEMAELNKNGDAINEKIKQLSSPTDEEKTLQNSRQEVKDNAENKEKIAKKNHLEELKALDDKKDQTESSIKLLKKLKKNQKKIDEIIDKKNSLNSEHDTAKTKAALKHDDEISRLGDQGPNQPERKKKKKRRGLAGILEQGRSDLEKDAKKTFQHWSNMGVNIDKQRLQIAKRYSDDLANFEKKFRADISECDKKLVELDKQRIRIMSELGEKIKIGDRNLNDAINDLNKSLLELDSKRLQVQKKFEKEILNLRDEAKKTIEYYDKELVQLDKKRIEEIEILKKDLKKEVTEPLARSYKEKLDLINEKKALESLNHQKNKVIDAVEKELSNVKKNIKDISEEIRSGRDDYANKAKLRLEQITDSIEKNYEDFEKQVDDTYKQGQKIIGEKSKSIAEKKNIKLSPQEFLRQRSKDMANLRSDVQMSGSNLSRDAKKIGNQVKGVWDELYSPVAKEFSIDEKAKVMQQSRQEFLRQRSKDMAHLHTDMQRAGSKLSRAAKKDGENFRRDAKKAGSHAKNSWDKLSDAFAKEIGDDFEKHVTKQGRRALQDITDDMSEAFKPLSDYTTEKIAPVLKQAVKGVMQSQVATVRLQLEFAAEIAKAFGDKKSSERLKKISNKIRDEVDKAADFVNLVGSELLKAENSIKTAASILLTGGTGIAAVAMNVAVSALINVAQKKSVDGKSIAISLVSAQLGQSATSMAGLKEGLLEEMMKQSTANVFQEILTQVDKGEEIDEQVLLKKALAGAVGACATSISNDIFPDDDGAAQIFNQTLNAMMTSAGESIANDLIDGKSTDPETTLQNSAKAGVSAAASTVHSKLVKTAISSIGDTVTSVSQPTQKNDQPLDHDDQNRTESTLESAQKDDQPLGHDSQDRTESTLESAQKDDQPLSHDSQDRTENTLETARKDDQPLSRDSQNRAENTLKPTQKDVPSLSSGESTTQIESFQVEEKETKKSVYSHNTSRNKSSELVGEHRHVNKTDITLYSDGKAKVGASVSGSGPIPEEVKLEARVYDAVYRNEQTLNPQDPKSPKVEVALGEAEINLEAKVTKKHNEVGVAVKAGAGVNVASQSISYESPTISALGLTAKAAIKLAIGLGAKISSGLSVVVKNGKPKYSFSFASYVGVGGESESSLSPGFDTELAKRSEKKFEELCVKMRTDKALMKIDQQIEKAKKEKDFVKVSHLEITKDELIKPLLEAAVTSESLPAVR